MTPYIGKIPSRATQMHPFKNSALSFKALRTPIQNREGVHPGYQASIHFTGWIVSRIKLVHYLYRAMLAIYLPGRTVCQITSKLLPLFCSRFGFLI